MSVNTWQSPNVWGGSGVTVTAESQEYNVTFYDGTVVIADVWTDKPKEVTNWDDQSSVATIWTDK